MPDLNKFEHFQGRGNRPTPGWGGGVGEDRTRAIFLRGRVLRQRVLNRSWLVIYINIQISESKFSESNILTMVEVLIHYGANPCQQNATGWTSLHSAAKRGNVEIMKALLQSGPSDINIANVKGKTPLMAAVEKDKVQIIRLVADSRFPNWDGPQHRQTPT